MAASESDFTGLSETGEDIAAQWPEIVRAVQALALYFTAKVATGTEPNDVLNGIALGDVAWRVVISGSDLLVQENTGTTASPTWTTRNTFSAGSGLGSLAASVLTSGTLADARVAESNVTQHEAAITHGNLSGLVTGDPHTQYAKKAGDTFTGTATFSGSPPVSGIDLEDLGDGPNTSPSTGDVLSWDGTRWEAGDLPLNPDDTYQETDSDQAGIAGTETAIQFASPDAGEGIAFPGADGTKDYYVDAGIEADSVGSGGWEFEFRFRVGTTGTSASDALEKSFKFEWSAGSQNKTVRLPLIKVVNPGASDVLSLHVIRTAGTGTITVNGSTRPGTIRIWRAA